MQFDRNGRLVRAWGSTGSGNGQFNFRTEERPAGAIGVDARGTVLVLDAAGRLQRFSSHGTFLSVHLFGHGHAPAQFDHPTAMAVDSAGNFYVTDGGNARVQKFDARGRFLLSWGRPGTGPGEFGVPTQIALDPSGNVYVTDDADRRQRVQIFDASGRFLGQFGRYGTGPAQFHEAGGIAIDRHGHVYVGDAWGHRIQQFDTRGQYLGEWGSAGRGGGQFLVLGALGVDSLNSIYALGSNGAGS
ncbi:MAG TPA: 6-bladed beta-propeller, partial [Dehalococcoidia bacterium]|nr:6-bladed beta-propeller [Dehalococcoidia bacterium]